MQKFRNIIFIALLGLLFAEVLIVFPAHVGRQKDASAPATPSDEAEMTAPGATEQKMRGVHLVESQKGSRDWELFAQAAEGNQGKGTWNLQNMRVLFYNRDKVEFTVTGQDGSIDMKTKDMRVRGDVVTTSANGYTFRTQEVEYSSQNRKIISPSAVLMTGPKDRDGEGMKVRGRRMIVDVESSRMTIPESVTAEKAISRGRFVKLASQAVEFSGRNKTARFSGNVVMEYDRMKVEGPEASFLSAGSDNFLSNVQFSGGIKVSDLDKFATSENLNLDLLANRFVFTGKPKVYQNNDELSGEQIIFLDGGKKVKVEGVRARVEKTEK
ncbi:MAG: LPS export ABC transporter periplasmic protein LptC [Bdellovibrionaceae bacterium]|nr:LPS export ABC transporter periplasmic protein LptC [Pseudobdellovibrionaceae bacterium]